MTKRITVGSLPILNKNILNHNQYEHELPTGIAVTPSQIGIPMNLLSKTGDRQHLTVPRLAAPVITENISENVSASLIRQVPTSPIRQVPVSTIRQVPVSTIRQVPVSTIRQVPVSTIRQVPVSVTQSYNPIRPANPSDPIALRHFDSVGVPQNLAKKTYTAPVFPSRSKYDRESEIFGNPSSSTEGVAQEHLPRRPNRFSSKAIDIENRVCPTCDKVSKLDGSKTLEQMKMNEISLCFSGCIEKYFEAIKFGECSAAESLIKTVRFQKYVIKQVDSFLKILIEGNVERFDHVQHLTSKGLGVEVHEEQDGVKKQHLIILPDYTWVLEEAKRNFLNDLIRNHIPDTKSINFIGENESRTFNHEHDERVWTIETHMIGRDEFGTHLVPLYGERLYRKTDTHKLGCGVTNICPLKPTTVYYHQENCEPCDFNPPVRQGYKPNCPT